MPPSKIMIIRHAEKPPKDGGPPLGVDPDGTVGGDNLIVRGWQRAGALVRFFAPTSGHLARPNFLFAAKADADSPSRRAQETIAPLAAELALTPDTSFAPDDVTKAGQAILAQSGVGLVAWEHHNIGPLVTAITMGTVRPPHWDGDRFDMVLVLDAGPDGSWRLTQVPQMLLPGDSDEPLPLKHSEG